MRCPKCGSKSVIRYTSPVFPVIWYYHCNNCDYDWYGLNYVGLGVIIGAIVGGILGWRIQAVKD